MKIRLLTILCMTALLYASCGKEASLEKKTQTPGDTTGTPGNKNGLLTKMVIKQRSSRDSSVYTFQYDSGKRIIRVNQTGPVDGQPYIAEQSYRYYRNAGGLVERYVQHIAATINNVRYEDSVVYHLHFNGDRFDYAIRDVLDIPEPPIRDSVKYGYDANGRINNVHALRYKNNSWTEFQNTVYTYDTKGNIMKIVFTYDNPADPPQIITVQYNDKNSAANFGNDFLIEGLFSPGFCSPNAVINLDNPDAPDKHAFSYEYNTAGKPATGVANDLVRNEKADLYYYYQ